MLYTAPSFLFLFLPLVLAVYALMPQPSRRYAIVLFNFAFYALACWNEPISLVLALLTAAFTYSAGFVIAVTHQRRTLLAAVVINCIAFLTYRLFYSYSLSLGSPYYPLGASFYLLASLSYLIDIYRNDAPHAKNFADLFLYMFFFPTLVVGPVIKYKEFNGMIERISFSLENFSEGVKLYIAGFLKRISIAAVLSSILSQTLEVCAGKMSILLAVFCLVFICAQVYFTFSGYSDMARGMMYMLGIPHAPDILSPFAATSPADYLRRFFVSMSRWIEDYLVYPILRTRRIPARTRCFLTPVIYCVVPSLWFKTRWYMLLPVLPVLLCFLPFMLRGPRRRLPRMPIRLRRLIGRVSGLLLFVLFWFFAALGSFSEVWTYLGQILQNGFSAPPYSMITVLSSLRYLAVGILGLLSLRLLGGAAEPRLQKLPRLVSISVRTLALVLVMVCFSFSILHFLPQYPQYAVMAYEYIVL